MAQCGLQDKFLCGRNAQGAGWAEWDGEVGSAGRLESRLRMVSMCTDTIDTLENTCRELDGSFRIGEVLMESWLATYRHCMGGIVQSAAALVTQLFEVMLGKHAMLHWWGHPTWRGCSRLWPVINGDTGYTATYGGVLLMLVHASSFSSTHSFSCLSCLLVITVIWTFRSGGVSGFDSSHVFCFIVHCTYLLVIHATWT